MMYAIALGSNQRHPKFGAPHKVIAAAIHRLSQPPFVLLAQAIPIRSRPIGPSQREYSNSAVLIFTVLDPMQLLAQLKIIEAQFGRRRLGQRWRARVLDLDIILWSGGIWSDPKLSVPHPLFRARKFVLAPLTQIAADWRDPISHLTVRHLKARLDRATIRP